MPSDKPPKTESVPKSVSDFTVLTLTLPSVSLPKPIANAKHYLYIKPHETSYATANEERSLFISNIPIDANEGNIRTSFADQLGGARVEHVEFDSSVPGVPQVKRFKSGTAKSSEGGEKKGKKRKRDEEVVAEGVVEDEESALPKIWGSELRKSGGTAVVVFVDRASMKGAWREVQRVVKEGADVMWIPGEGLGIERMLHTHADIETWRLIWISNHANYLISQATKPTTHSPTHPARPYNPA
jgi:ribosomal RNA-processing protein 7